MARITADDVRNYILDLSIQQTALGTDLYYSDEEIMDAMRRTAREFNSFPPFSIKVSPDNLTDETNMFLDGIVQQLCLSKIHQLSREDIDYNASGVQTNIVQKQIQHLRQFAVEHGERFKKAATDAKVFTNLSHAYWSM